jgi:hypothetical protein
MSSTTLLPDPTQTQTLSEAWAQTLAIVRSLRDMAQGQIDASLAGPVTSSSILQFEQYLRSYVTRLDALTAIPGLAQYASSQPGMPAGYDLAANWATTRGAMNQVDSWIQNNYPKAVDPVDGKTRMLEREMTANGPVERTFDTATLAGYRTQIATMLNAIR